MCSWDRDREPRVLRMHMTREVILPMKPRSLDRLERRVLRGMQVLWEMQVRREPPATWEPQEPLSQLSRPRGIPT